MTDPIRILIADDTATSRELLRLILEDDDAIVVAGAARDGHEAVRLCHALRPDLVLMDINMPGMDGYEATRQIMAQTPTPIVIVSAALSAEQLGSSLEATRAGAVAVLRKPVGPGHPDFEAERTQLLRTVHTMAGVKVVKRWRAARGVASRVGASITPASPPLAGDAGSPSPARARVVGIAASTGGPAALHTVLAGLPADFDAPILVVQHIADGFVEGLARWLGRATPLTVAVARHGQALHPGCVYLAPTGAHLGVSLGHQVQLSGADPIHGFRPSATHLFETLAMAFGRGAWGVVLTGMGDDGVAGLHHVRACGGHIVAQDEASSVIFGMPGATIAAGLADEVLPLEQVADRLRAALGAQVSP